MSQAALVPSLRMRRPARLKRKARPPPRGKLTQSAAIGIPPAARRREGRRRERRATTRVLAAPVPLPPPTRTRALHLQ